MIVLFLLIQIVISINTNQIIIVNDTNEIITHFYHYMIIAFHLNCDEFFFNSIQSSSQSDIEEYHFCVWWILKEIIISFLFIQMRRHITNVFSLHDCHHTSNQSSFPTMTLLSTSFFQQFSIFQQFKSSISFTINPIIAI